MTGSFMNPLSRGSGGLLSRTREIKAWTRDIFNLPEDAVVSVNELACHVPGCPPKETVVLIILNNHTVQVSIHKGILEVTKEDISQAPSANDFVYVNSR